MDYNETCASGVSWPAIVGGAFVTAALSVILLALGTGLGLSAVSPWMDVGASASSLGTAVIVWMIAIQVISSSMGGFIAGRLRIKWAAIHTNEVYFRDTAHGFLVWAVALVITATFLASTAVNMIGVTSPLAFTHEARGLSFDPVAYFVDSLFRASQPVEFTNDSALRAEVGTILAHALSRKEIPAADKAYLVQLVSVRTGLQPVEAGNRVMAVFSDAQKTAESARKAAMHVVLWLFIALLCGAFCSSYAATIGGRQRDNVVAISHDFKTNQAHA